MKIETIQIPEFTKINLIVEFKESSRLSKEQKQSITDDLHKVFVGTLTTTIINESDIESITVIQKL